MVEVEVGIQLDVPIGVGGGLFENQEVRLADLVSAEDPVIRGATFSHCRVYGPAILAPLGATSINNSVLGPSVETVMWPVARGSRRVGAIGAEDCLFEGCDFVGVGFAVPEDELPAVE